MLAQQRRHSRSKKMIRKKYWLALISISTVIFLFFLFGGSSRETLVEISKTVGEDDFSDSSSEQVSKSDPKTSIAFTLQKAFAELASRAFCSEQRGNPDLRRLQRFSRIEYGRLQHFRLVSETEVGVKGSEFESSVEYPPGWSVTTPLSMLLYDPIFLNTPVKDECERWKKRTTTSEPASPDAIIDRCNTKSGSIVRSDGYLPFVIVASDAYLGNNGELFDCEEVVCSDFTCRPEECTNAVDLSSARKIDARVISIAQFWGDNVYHLFVECAPRLMALYEEVLANPEVLIHINKPKTDSLQPHVSLLEFLGIPKTRLVWGTVQAKEAIFPTRIGCGATNAFLVRRLSHVFHKRLHDHFPDRVRYSETRRSVPRSEWSQPRILLLKRSGQRNIVQHNQLANALRYRFPHSVQIYDDQKTPELPELLLMYHEATLVIAPHGAGLSNVIACRKDARVLEFSTNCHDVNVCYIDLSRKLGLIHYVFTPKESNYYGPISIDNIPEVMNLVERIVAEGSSS